MRGLILEGPIKVRWLPAFATLSFASPFTRSDPDQLSPPFVYERAEEPDEVVEFPSWEPDLHADLQIPNNWKRTEIKQVAQPWPQLIPGVATGGEDDQSFSCAQREVPLTDLQLNWLSEISQDVTPHWLNSAGSRRRSRFLQNLLGCLRIKNETAHVAILAILPGAIRHCTIISASRIQPETPMYRVLLVNRSERKCYELYKQAPITGEAAMSSRSPLQGHRSSLSHPVPQNAATIVEATATGETAGFDPETARRETAVMDAGWNPQDFKSISDNFFEPKGNHDEALAFFESMTDDLETRRALEKHFTHAYKSLWRIFPANLLRVERREVNLEDIPRPSGSCKGSCSCCGPKIEPLRSGLPRMDWNSVIGRLKARTGVDLELTTIDFWNRGVSFVLMASALLTADTSLDTHVLHSAGEKTITHWIFSARNSERNHAAAVHLYDEAQEKAFALRKNLTADPPASITREEADNFIQRECYRRKRELRSSTSRCVVS